MTSLSNKAAYLIVLNLIKYAIGFFVPVLLARLLTKDDYGAYQQVLLLANTTVGIMVLGIPTSIYYFYNRSVDNDDRKTLVTQSFFVLNVAALISVIVLYVFRENIAAFLNNDNLVEYIPFLLPYVYCYLASEYFFHLLVSKDQYAKSVIYGVSESLLRSFLVLIAAFILQDVLYIVLAISIYALIRYIYCLIYTMGDLATTSVVKERSYIKDQLIYSLPLAFTSLVGLIGRLMDRFFITVNFTTTQFANYAVGAIELPLDVIFQGAVANVLRTKLPVLVKEKNYSEISKLINESTRKLSLIILPIFIFLMAYAEEFVVLLFSDKYIESVIIFKIYLMLTPLHIFILSVVPQSFGLTSIGLKISTFTVSANLVLSYILLKYMGFVGPAISTVFTIYVGIAIYIIVVRKLLSVPTYAFIPYMYIGKTSALCLLIIFMLNLLDVNTGKEISFLINGLIFLAIYILTGWGSGLFTDYDKQLLINFFKKKLLRQ